MNSQEITLLVEKAMQCDKQAFEALCEEKSRGILYRANLILGSYEDAEDVAQEVVVKMYRYLPTLRNPETFNAWLHTIIVNESNKMLRKRKREIQPVHLEDGLESCAEEYRMEYLPQDFLDNEAKKQWLAALVESLPKKQREVLHLYYYEEMSCAEIAKATSRTVGSVTYNLSSARKSITSAVQAQYGGQRNAALSFAAALPVMHAAFYKAVPEAVARDFAAGLAALPPLQAPMGKPNPQKATGQKLLKAAGAAVAAALCIAGVALAGKALGTVKTTDAFTPSTATGTQPPASASQAGVPGQSQALQGQVLLVDNRGIPLQNTSYALGGLTVQLAADAGNTVHTTTTQPDGSFSFQATALPPTGCYTAYLHLGEDSLYNQTGAQKAKVEGTDSENQILFYVSVTKTPNGAIQASHRNPGMVEYTGSLTEIAHYAWQVTGRDTGTLALKGSTQTADVQSLPAGSYTIRYHVTDVFGNEADASFDFYIE